MAVSGLDSLFEQLRWNSQQYLNIELDQVDTSSSINDQLTSSTKNKFQLVKEENEQIKDLNDILTMEVNELKIKLKFYEERMRMQDSYISQLKSELEDENSKMSEHFKVQQNNPQVLFKAIQKSPLRDGRDDSSQKIDFHNKQRHNTANLNLNVKNEDQNFSLLNVIQNKQRDRSFTSGPMKKNAYKRSKTKEMSQNIRTQLISSNQEPDGQAEIKEVTVEKSDLIVAVGYEYLKEGSSFKPKAQIGMIKDKRLHREHNNSSSDVNFLLKERKMSYFRNNIEQKTQNLFENLIQGSESSDFSEHFFRSREQSYGCNIGQLNINLTTSEQSINFPIDQNSNNKRENIYNNTTSINNTPRITINSDSQNNNLTASSSSPHSNNSIQIPRSNYLHNKPTSKFATLLNESVQALYQQVDQNLTNSNDQQSSSHNIEDSTNLKSIQEVNEQDPEIAKYEQECDRFQKLYNDIKQYGSLGDLLFEEFMLIGPDLNELKQQMEQLPSPFKGGKGSTLEYTKGKVKQTILFNKPCYASPLVCEKRQAVAQFAFPKGLQYYRYKGQEDLENMPSRYKDILLLNLCQQKNQGMNEKMFVLNMRGEEENMSINNTLSLINPNSILYAICYQQEDVLVLTDQSTGEKTIFLFPVVYCFLTYYPFIDYFENIILEIVNRVKTVRLVKSSFAGSIDNTLQNADIQQVLTTLQKDRDLCLSLKTLQIKDVQPERVISYYLNTPRDYLLKPDTTGEERNSNYEIASIDTECKLNKEDSNSNEDAIERKSSLNCSTIQTSKFSTTSLIIPAIEDMGYIEGLEAAYLTFSNLHYYDFQMILTLIMLEKKVVFLSKNITLLTLTTLTFQTLFKPIKYPHPVIFSITDDLIYFLEAPVPIIVGVNLSSEQFEYEFGYNDECYYVDLDKNFIFTKNEESMSKIESIKYQFNDSKEQIKALFAQINNEITSKQFGNKFKKLIQISNNDKKLQYKHDAKQISNLKTLLQLIRKSFQENIIQKLPVNPIFKDDNQSELDMGEIQSQVLKDNPESPFLQYFVETQIFYFFMEQRYF